VSPPKSPFGRFLSNGKGLFRPDTEARGIPTTLAPFVDFDGKVPVSGILPDHEIRRRVRIDPFAEGAKRQGVISYGLTSYGYDARIGRRFKLFSNVLQAGVVDPKTVIPDHYVDIEADSVVIPPNSYLLGETVEKFEIPRDVLALCVGKSTYARCGVIVNVTPLEAQWRGRVTVEVSNATPLPVRIHANEGIMQVLFFGAVVECDVSYEDKQGKYQDQPGLVLPMVDGGESR
jgi:dCTP deaminase